MKYEKREGGIALVDNDGNILGWVLSSINKQWVYEIVGESKDYHCNKFSTEQAAKTALLIEISKRRNS